jgi:hypothetical protein
LLGLVYREVQRQASLMSFLDDFRLIAYMFFVLSPVALLMRRPQRAGAAVSAH